MNKWKKMVVLLFCALFVMTGSLAHVIAAETAGSQKILEIVPLKAEVKSASNVSDSLPGYVHRLATEPLHLQGVDQSHDFYYLVPKVDLGDNNYIELVWSQSELLVAAHSTLTILVDDKPLKSVFLNGEMNSTKIALEREDVSPGYHKVTVLKHSVITDDLCSDQFNPANWVKIEPASFVFIDAKSTAIVEDPLKEFPYPFIEQGTPDEVYGTIVLPDSPSAELIASALEVATHLSSHSASKKPMPIITETEWSNSADSSHVLMIGSMESWTGPVRKAVQDHQIRSENEELVLQYFSIAHGNTNEAKQMLLVTAENDQVIEDKMHVLTDRTLAKQLTGSKLAVKQTPKQTVVNSILNELTFASFGYDHVLLDEVNSQSANLYITIPSYWKRTGVSSLELKLKVSPLLMNEGQIDEKGKYRTERNGLTVKINGIPTTISLETLQPDHYETDTYSVRIPLDSFLQEQGQGNALNIVFTANITEFEGICHRGKNSGNWIFIDKESRFDIPHEISKESSFQYWPAPFVSDKGWDQTALIVPQNVNGTFLTQLSMIANELVSQTNNEKRVTVLSEPLDTEAQRKLENHNIMVFGDQSRYPSLQWNQDQWQLSGYNVINETAQYAAWIRPSVWNKDYAFAIFQTMDEQRKEKGEFIHSNLLQFLKSEQGNSQIAVMSKSGEALYIDLKQESFAHPEVNHGSSDSVEQETNVPVWLWAAVLILFAAVLTVYSWLWRRRRKERS